MEWKWNGKGMEMEWKFYQKKSRHQMERKRNGNGMEVLSEKKSTPYGTEMEWTWNGNGMEKIW